MTRTSIQTLSSEFLKQFNIAKVIETFPPSGQKSVYLVERNDGLQILKIFIHGNERDLQEIELLKKYDSLSGIPCILDYSVHEGQLIVFEEYIEGNDLQEILDSYIGDEKKIISLLIEIIDIMEPVWSGKVIHRDLKPKNLKILNDGKPVILDFGIARDLDAESITGTGEGQPMSWDYASPEQYKGDKDSISYRTDFFALGLIAYRLYYGNHPFGTTREEIASRFAENEELPALEEDNQLNKFIVTTLTLNPSGRPRNITLLKKDLT